jgi:hypothetical protein
MIQLPRATSDAERWLPRHGLSLGFEQRAELFGIERAPSTAKIEQPRSTPLTKRCRTTQCAADQRGSSCQAHTRPITPIADQLAAADGPKTPRDRKR